MQDTLELLFANTITGRESRKHEMELQREALNFDFFSRRDSVAERLEAFGKTFYKTVQDVIEVTDPIPFFYDVEPGRIDEVLELHEVYGGRVYPWTPGAELRVSRLYNKAWTVVRSGYQTAFKHVVEDLQSGRVLVSDMVREAARVVLAQKVKVAFDALTAAYQPGGAYSINQNNADLTKANLDSAIRAVADAAGAVRAIVGVESALFPISNFTGYDQSASAAGTGFPEAVKMEIHQKGFMGKYRGALVVRLSPYRDPRYNTTAYNASDVWVLPADEKKNFNVFTEVDEGQAEPPIVNQATHEIILPYRFECGAAVASHKLSYARRIYNVATS